MEGEARRSVDDDELAAVEASDHGPRSEGTQEHVDKGSSTKESGDRAVEAGEPHPPASARPDRPQISDPEDPIVAAVRACCDDYAAYTLTPESPQVGLVLYVSVMLFVVR